MNPHGLRVGVIKDWNSKWYASKSDFSTFLNRDIQEQDEIERRAQEKALREFLAEYNETH